MMIVIFNSNVGKNGCTAEREEEKYLLHKEGPSFKCLFHCESSYITSTDGFYIDYLFIFK